MLSKYLLSNCGIHENCTIKAGFAAEDDPDFDSISDCKPVSERLQIHAESSFGSVFCVSLEHLSGRLSVALPG